MPNKPTPIDTNLIIRYLTNDTPQQAERVEKLFKNTKKNSLVIPDIIFAEIVWVLQSFYQLPKNEIIEKLEGILSVQSIVMNRKLLRLSITYFREHSISYTDAYLLAFSSIKGNKHVYSFDKGLDKVKNVKRLDP